MSAYMLILYRLQYSHQQILKRWQRQSWRASLRFSDSSCPALHCAKNNHVTFTDKHDSEDQVTLTTNTTKKSKLLSLTDTRTHIPKIQFFQLIDLGLFYLNNFRVFKLNYFRAFQLKDFRVFQLDNFRVFQLNNFRVFQLNDFRVFHLNDFRVFQLNDFRVFQLNKQL